MADPVFQELGTLQYTAGTYVTSLATTIQNVQVGDLLVVVVQRDSQNLCTGVASTSPALTFTKIVTANSNSSNFNSDLWAAIATSAASSQVITASYSSSASWGSIFSARYSGGISSLTPNATTVHTTLQASSTNRTNANMTTTARTLMIAFGSNWNDYFLVSAATNWTLRVNSDTFGNDTTTQFLLERVADAGTYPSGNYGTNATADQYFSGIAAFPVSSGGITATGSIATISLSATSATAIEEVTVTGATSTVSISSITAVATDALTAIGNTSTVSISSINATATEAVIATVSISTITISSVNATASEDLIVTGATSTITISSVDAIGSEGLIAIGNTAEITLSSVNATAFEDVIVIGNTAEVTISSVDATASIESSITATATIAPITISSVNATPTFTSTSTFSNTNAITIPSGPASASPYPVNITVSNMQGVTSKVTCTLTGISHTWPSDIDVLLVSPTGHSVLLVSDCGSGTAISNVNLTFDDSAATSLTTDTITTGTYKPSNVNTKLSGQITLPIVDIVPSPAPILSTNGYSILLSNFNGVSPNGIWKLYVYDDGSQDSGSISSGISITITTTNGNRVLNTLPALDIIKNYWGASTGTDLFARIDANDAEYIEAKHAATCEIQLLPLKSNIDATGMVIKVTAKSSLGSNLIVTLKQGDTTIATRTFNAVTSDYTVYTITLTLQEYALITDPSILRVTLGVS